MSITTYARAQLAKIYAENERFRLQQIINSVTNDIKIDIINRNRQGFKNYSITMTGDRESVTEKVQYISNGKNTIDEIIKKLNTIFIDSYFTLEKVMDEDIYTLTIDWVF
jgi:NCAIR mutase (PurE)-related protein